MPNPTELTGTATRPGPDAGCGLLRWSRTARGWLGVGLGFLLSGWAFAQPAAPVAHEPVAAQVGVGADTELADGEEAFAAAQQALTRAESEPEKLRALFTVVNLQRRRGDYLAGLAGARDGLERAQRLGDQRLQVDFLYLLGRIHWNLTDYPKALETHLEELRLSEKLNDPAVQARTHGGLGLTYYRYGKKEDALVHFERGLVLAGQAGDEHLRASLLNGLGNYYLGEHDYVRAAAIHEQALKIREKFGNRRGVAESLTNLGLIADLQGDPARALAYLQQALQTFEVLKYRRYIANTHRRLALVLRKSGRTDEALAHLQQARQIAETLDSAEVMADIYQEFTLTHEARGEWAEALGFQRKLAAVREDMRSEQDRQRIAELRARYGDEQRELEIALLKRDQELQQAEIRRRRFQNIALGAGLVGGMVLLGAVIFVQLARLRASRRLHAATEHARERAETAERLKSRLLMMASHDLKVPLSALNATASLIRDAAADVPTVRRLAAIMQADTARMRSLVRDFLDAAAIEEGNLQLHTAEIDLVGLASSAVDTLRAVASAKKQTLICEPPAQPLPAIEADASRLRQVFDNLIGNAIKFTPEEGRIEVSFGEASGWAYAEVRDNGPGLGPQDFAKIFAPRERLTPEKSGLTDSSGLGLVIVRELLMLQGGRLEVQSRPGSGAVFRVLLPVAAPPTVV